MVFYGLVNSYMFNMLIFSTFDLQSLSFVYLYELLLFMISGWCVSYNASYEISHRFFIWNTLFFLSSFEKTSNLFIVWIYTISEISVIPPGEVLCTKNVYDNNCLWSISMSSKWSKTNFNQILNLILFYNGNLLPDIWNKLWFLLTQVQYFAVSDSTRPQVA